MVDTADAESTALEQTISSSLKTCLRGGVPVVTAVPAGLTTWFRSTLRA